MSTKSAAKRFKEKQMNVILITLGLSLFSRASSAGILDAVWGGGFKSTKLYSDMLIGKPFAEATKKFGDFKVDSQYVCQTPPNCDYSYIRNERSQCLITKRAIIADSKTGNIKTHEAAFGGQCSQYHDQMPVKDFLPLDFPKPKWIHRPADTRMVTAIWMDGDQLFSITAWCGKDVGSSADTGPVVDNFRECRINSYTFQTRDEKTIPASNKQNTFNYN